ncbi:uncharacterized protein ACO6RY_15118 [Pungitius sinensis]
MEQSLRTALWVFCLFGFLQAAPACDGQGDLNFCVLQRDVKCVNVTFTYPTNVQASCSQDALQHFRRGLEKAKNNCVDDKDLVLDILDALNFQFPTTSSTNCTLQTKESRFKDFVEDLESHVQLLNTLSGKRAN